MRDPWSWYASARRWEPRWRRREEAIEHWCRVSKGALKWRKHTSPAFLTLSFNDLLGRTEETISRVAAWLGIDFVPGLLVPTFNGRPISANTSFADVSTSVSTKPLERAGQELGRRRHAIRHRARRAPVQRLLAAVEKDRAAFPAA